MTEPEQADFVLAHGTEALGHGDAEEPEPISVEQMKALLARCAAQSERRIPLIVANPDLVTVDGEELRVMPGSLGKHYQQLGGEVHP